MELIAQLAKDRKYWPLCKQYAKRDWLADELHQEFLLRLCEKGEGDLIEARDGGYMDWHCFSIVSKIWGKKNRVKCYDKGATNPLFELTGLIEIEAPDELIQDDYFDFGPYLKESIEHIQRDINSDDMVLNFRSRVFAYSVGFKIEDGKVINGGNFKSIRQFSNTTKIPMSAAHAAFVHYKKTLRKRLKV